MNEADYQDILVQTFLNRGEKSTRSVRVRPLPGQGFDPELRVECSRQLRDQHPIGSILRIKVKLTDRLGESQFLYSHYSWPYELISPQEAESILSQSK